MRRVRVLIVEDERKLAQAVASALKGEHYDVVVAATGEDGFFRANAEAFDLVLLDVMLPGRSGLEILQTLRQRHIDTPVLILTARDGVDDRVLGLDLGADDYLVKPFALPELLARIRALLRRSSTEETKVVSFGEVQVDLTRRVVMKKNEELKMTRAEYNLLTYFLQNPDRALSRDMILNSVWGYESFPNTRTVDAHVVRLRQKLEADAGTPQHFLTVHGVGYRFLP